MMTDAPVCARCGTLLDSYAPEGICPRCMLQSGLAKTILDPCIDSAEAPATRDEIFSPLAPVSLGRFGNYELLEEIGHGGMGVVYQARQLGLERMVAVKMLLLGPFSSEEVVRRFRREAESAAVLQHPNIVAIHEVGEVEGQPFYSMDYVAGRSLAELIRQSPLPPRQAAAYAKTIAQSIHYAHQRGILHRDLKPANILIDGATGEVRITDFGLAKRLDQDSSLTLTGQTIGSPNYLPPEQAAGRQAEVGPSSDVYSMGAILYESLTGRPPFLAQSLQETLLQIRDAEPAAPRALNPALPRDLETICLKCLEKDPGKRYPSAQALADDLDRFLDDRPIQARPVGRPERVWRWCRRQPVLAGLMLSMVLLLLVAAMGASIAAWRIQQHREHAERTLYKSDWERAEELFRSDKSARGMARLAFLLRQNPSDLAVAERLMSELMYRSFALPLTSPMPHPDYVYAAIFSPDGRYLVTTCRDNSARIWNAMTGERVGRPLEHDPRVIRDDLYRTGEIPLFAVFSPDGRYLATASVDRTARLWDARTGEPAGPPLPHNTAVISVQFSPDGNRVATGSDSGQIRIWDVPSGASGVLLVQPAKHLDTVNALCFSPDGSRLATGSDDTTSAVWDAVTGERICRFTGHRDAIKSIEFSPGGEKVITAAGSRDGTARIWDAVTGAPLTPALRHSGVVFSARFSPDGLWVVTASQDNTACIWNAEDGVRRGLPLAHSGTVRYAEFSPDGQRVVTASEDRTARVWDVSSTQPLTEPIPHGGIVRSARFSPDSRRIATASADQTGRIWDAATGAPLAGPLQHSAGLVSACFSPDGQWVVTASSDHTARIWSAATGLAAGEPMKHRGAVHSAEFSPDGQFVATASADDTACVWDARTGKPVTESLKHDAPVQVARFDRDGRRLLTASWDGTARLWDTETGLPLSLPLAHKKDLKSAQSSPDGRWVLTGSLDWSARLWEVPRLESAPPSWLPELAEAIVRLRLDPARALEGVSAEAILDWKARLEKTNEPDNYHRWARWFFADRETRRISPSSSLNGASTSGAVPVQQQLQTGDRSRQPRLLQFLGVFCGRQLALEFEQGILDLEHHLLALMPVFLTQTTDFILQANDQIRRVIKFLSQARDLLLVLLNISGQEDLGTKQIKQLFPHGDWPEDARACGELLLPVGGFRRRSSSCRDGWPRFPQDIHPSR